MTALHPLTAPPETSSLERTSQVLLRRLAGVTSKFRGVALGIVAEAGAGKTHAVRRALDLITCQHVVIHAVEPLRRLKARLPSATKTPPAWAMNVLEQLETGQASGIKQVAQALAAYLDATSPVAIHLEDVHDATPEQVELWSLVADMARRTRGVALVATSRSALPAAFEELELNPLDEDGIKTLLETRAGGAVPPEAIRWIASRADGNPLFALEFFQHLTHQGSLWSNGQSWSWRAPDTHALPRSLSAMIADRLEGVALTSANPKVMRERLLELALLPEQEAVHEASPELAELQHGGLWREGRFSHRLYLEVLRDRLWTQDRERVARRWLETVIDTCPESAGRVLRAANLEPGAAVSAWERIAETAEHHGDQLVAGRALAEAVLLSEGTKRGALALRASRLLKKLDKPESSRLMSLAVQLAPSDPALTLEYGDMLNVNNDFDEAERLEAALSPTQGFDAERVALRIRIRARRGDPRGAVALWEQHEAFHAAFVHLGITSLYVVDALIITARFDDASSLIAWLWEQNEDAKFRVQVLNVKMQLHSKCGRLEAALEVADEALRLLETVPPGDQSMLDLHMRLYNNRANLLLGLMRPRAAVDDMERALEISQRLGDSARLAGLQSNLGGCLKALGEFQRAEQLLLEARAELDRHGLSRFRVSVEVQLATLYVDWLPPMGAALAVKHTREALSLSRRLGNEPDALKLLPQIAWAEAVHGNAKLALEILDDHARLVLKHREPTYGVFAQWMRALSLERLGKLNEAIALMEESLRQIRNLQADWNLARLELELYRMRDDKQSARHALETLRARGEEGATALHVLKRYFPRLFETKTPSLAPEQPAPSLEVLGEMRFNRAPLSLRLRKARELVALLLEARLAGRQHVTSLEALDGLYKGEDEVQSSAAIRQLLYRLRKTLGDDLIQRTSQGYVLAVKSDAEQFLETLDTRLWRGDYLQGVAFASAPSVLEALHHALKRGVERQLELDPVEAARAGRILLRGQPLDLEVLHLTLRALRAVDADDIGSLYASSRAAFLQVGERLPRFWQDFAFEDGLFSRQREDS
jgi:tetratricopeptide (TPR) repeat protein